jgi:hypothetical protein
VPVPTWTRAAKCLSGAQQRRQWPSQALGHGTNDIWLLTGSPAEGWSAGGAQGNPCIEQGIKGPAQGNASRPDRLRRTCRMASKASCPSARTRATARAGLPDWLKSKNPAYEAMADADEVIE